jgi:hypothetical protein
MLMEGALVNDPCPGEESMLNYHLLIDILSGAHDVRQDACSASALIVSLLPLAVDFLPSSLIYDQYILIRVLNPIDTLKMPNWAAY